MILTFLTDSPLNSTVIDLDGDGHLYDISTTVDFSSTTTRSVTTVTSPDGKPVAVWERGYRREKDRITFHDKMHTLGDWLPKKSVLSKTRMLVAPNGDRYHWKQATGWGTTTLRLVNPRSQRTVAQLRSAREGSGFLSTPRRMSLHVQPEVESMLDVILVSFIVLEEIRREQAVMSLTSDGRSFAGASGTGVVVAGGTVIC